MMKMNNILLTVILIPACTFAGTEPTASPFPDVKKGINIWPMEKINMPGKSETMRGIKSFQENGYFETIETNESVESLLSMRKTAQIELKEYDNEQSLTDTHLRSNISKLKLSFRFNGISGVDGDDIIGFAAAGSYLPNKGWDGMVEFIDLHQLGICAFRTSGMDAVILAKEDLQYEVNHKPSTKHIAGNYLAGFSYTLHWYTDNRSFTLECANKELKTQNLIQMIQLANQIDKSFR